MDVIRYNKDYYIIKSFIQKDKFVSLVNSGAIYNKQPSNRFKISFSLYVPVDKKDEILSNFEDAVFIEDDIINHFYVGKYSDENKKNSFYTHEDISGLTIYFSLKELNNVRKILDLPARAAARTNVLHFSFLNEKRPLYLEDYLFNTNIDKLLNHNEDIKNVLFSDGENLSIITILSRYYLFS